MKISKIAESSGSLVDRIIEFLESQPDDEVFTTRELTEKFQKGINGGAFRANRHRWKDYEIKINFAGGMRSVWGNKNAIQTLRQQIKSAR